MSALNIPIDPHLLLRKKKSFLRELKQKKGLVDKRIAILGGSTTAEIKDMLELFLYEQGIRPLFYESAFNRFYEDILFPNEALEKFSPEIIYIHTSSVNIQRFPSANESKAGVEQLLNEELIRFTGVWDSIQQKYHCPVIQNNFELPHYRNLGNLSCYEPRGRSRFIEELNSRFSAEAMRRPSLYLNDLNYLAAWFGLENWHDKHYWHSYKYAMSYEAIPHVSYSVASIIKAIYGMTKKCLVLDLDNTLWGGIIGDDGLKGIQIGKETPEAEAYTEFQRYVKELHARGIILAVCSKNNLSTAREGFTHPDSILKLEDFSAFIANWEPKGKNIIDITKILNIGTDQIVFFDDNPAEREQVRLQHPEIAVPEPGTDVTQYINSLEKSGYFEVTGLSSEDFERNVFYAENKNREEAQKNLSNYDDFLAHLKMTAEIKPFTPLYFDRITQLINKSNQFNVTTKRYTQAEVETAAASLNHITLYGRLTDKFGDNGLVSIIIGEIKKDELHIDLWLMSCRVINRGMEDAMFDCLVAAAQNKNVKSLFGYYYPTPKNEMVRGLFKTMGFDPVNDSVWRFNIPDTPVRKNKFIMVTE